MKRVKRGGVSGAANGNRKRAASEAAAHVTYEEISQLFGLSLADAAARIGVRTARFLFVPGGCGRERLLVTREEGRRRRGP